MSWRIRAVELTINQTPLVSVVLLNYNGCRYLGSILDRCILSVLGSDYSNIELLFVDNGSDDDSVRHIMGKFRSDTRLRVVSLDRNYGTAKGHNIGIESSKGELFLLLNNDTWVPGNAIGKMVQILQEDNKVAAVSCRIVSPNGALQHEGFKFGPLFPVLGITHGPFLGKKPELYRDMPEAKRFDLLPGTALMVKKDALHELGTLYDEDYYTYTEDLDLCYRLRRKGYELVCITDIDIIHYGGGTGQQFSAWRADLTARNKLLFIYKNFHPLKVAASLLVNLVDAIRLFAMGFVTNDANRLREAKSRLNAYSYVKKSPIPPMRHRNSSQYESRGD